VGRKPDCFDGSITSSPVSVLARTSHLKIYEKEKKNFFKYIQ